MLSLTGRSADRERHHRRGHLVQAVRDAAQAETTQRRRETIGEVLAAEQCERQRRVSPIQELDAARRFSCIDLVQAKLAVQDVERPICLTPGLRAEMRRTVDQHAGAKDRVTDAAVTIEVALGHGANTTR